MKVSIFGSMYRFCSECNVHIHVENMHDEDDCRLLQREVAPERKRIPVPQVFYDAFSGQGQVDEQ